jgi:hypothetical protein
MKSSSRCADDVRDLRLLRGSSVPRAGCCVLGDGRWAMGGVGMERGRIHGNHEMQIQQVQEVR